ncbi:MAG: serine--tRNA ligase [bacterium]|nr:serine--tRNA ligase [bacterium]
MLDIRYIRENPQQVAGSIKRRGLKLDLKKLLSIDKDRLKLISETEKLRSQLKLEGKPIKAKIENLKKIKKSYEIKKTKLDRLDEQFDNLMLGIPNLIAPNTPDGGEKENRVEKSWGESNLNFIAKDHLSLNKKTAFVDFESAAKSSGNKFYYLKGKGASLWLALVNFVSELIKKEGFELMMVPHLVNNQVTSGTGFLPKGEERQIYHVEDSNLNLIATAEMPLTAYHMDEIIDLNRVEKIAGLSPCYRLEAGAYGKFSKGLYRVHQFDKLELYIFCKLEGSNNYLQKILALQEKIYQKLNIPYRVTRTATGDLSASAYEKYDLEYYAPAENKYRELTSCSNCTDFQTRRLNIRYRDKDNKLQFAHSLNGTAITSSRTLIAIIENYQTKDGSVNIPEVLQKYYGANKL